MNGELCALVPAVKRSLDEVKQKTYFAPSLD